MLWPSVAVNTNIWQVLARVWSAEGCLRAILLRYMVQVSANKYLSKWSWRDVTDFFPVEAQIRNPNLCYAIIQTSFWGTLCAN